MSRRVLVVLGALAGALGLLALLPPVAAAQPGAVQVVTHASAPSRDIHQSSGLGTSFLFWVFAAIVVAGAIFVITRRNLISAVMGMVATFFALAGLYMMLYASFLAAIQVLVYAGAIMVLFVFVIMVLNSRRNSRGAWSARPARSSPAWRCSTCWSASSASSWAVTAAVPQGRRAAPPAVTAAWSSRSARPAPTASRPCGRSPRPTTSARSRRSATALFGDYLFPFEAVSILLLVAVVGAIAVARPLTRRRAARRGPRRRSRGRVMNDLPRSTSAMATSWACRRCCS